MLSIVSKHNLHIAFIKNLASFELWSIFKLKSIIVLDQFGQFHMNLGGIGREALCCGRQLITGSVGPSDLLTVQQYGRPLPLYPATTPNEISSQILKSILEHDTWLTKHSRVVSKWSIKTFSDTSAFSSVLTELVEYTIQ